HVLKRERAFAQWRRRLRESTSGNRNKNRDNGFHELANSRLTTVRASVSLGSARLRRVGFGVSPKRSLKSSRSRDALANTRDARAPRNFRYLAVRVSLGLG